MYFHSHKKVWVNSVICPVLGTVWRSAGVRGWEGRTFTLEELSGKEDLGCMKNCSSSNSDFWWILSSDLHLLLSPLLTIHQHVQCTDQFLTLAWRPIFILVYIYQLGGWISVLAIQLDSDWINRPQLFIEKGAVVSQHGGKKAVDGRRVKVMEIGSGKISGGYRSRR